MILDFYSGTTELSLDRLRGPVSLTYAHGTALERKIYPSPLYQLTTLSISSTLFVYCVPHRTTVRYLWCREIEALRKFTAITEFDLDCNNLKHYSIRNVDRT